MAYRCYTSNGTSLMAQDPIWIQGATITLDICPLGRLVCPRLDHSSHWPTCIRHQASWGPLSGVHVHSVPGIGPVFPPLLHIPVRRVARGSVLCGGLPTPRMPGPSYITPSSWGTSWMAVPSAPRESTGSWAPPTAPPLPGNQGPSPQVTSIPPYRETLSSGSSGRSSLTSSPLIPMPWSATPWS